MTGKRTAVFAAALLAVSLVGTGLSAKRAMADVDVEEELADAVPGEASMEELAFADETAEEDPVVWEENDTPVEDSVVLEESDTSEEDAVDEAVPLGEYGGLFSLDKNPADVALQHMEEEQIVSEESPEAEMSDESDEPDEEIYDGSKYEEAEELFADGDDWYKDYEYSTEGTRILLKNYKGTGTQVEVPAEAVISGVKYATVVTDSVFAQKAVESVSFDYGLKLEGDVSYLFSGCEKLEYVLFNGADTSGVTNMEGMFANCSSLESIDLQTMNTSNVTNFSLMFANCPSLSALDLGSFDTGSGSLFSNMFCFCSKISSLNLSSFDLSHATNASDVEGMLDDCASLTEIYTPKTLNSNLSVGLPNPMYVKNADGTLGLVAYTDLMKTPAGVHIVTNTSSSGTNNGTEVTIQDNRSGYSGSGISAELEISKPNSYLIVSDTDGASIRAVLSQQNVQSTAIEVYDIDLMDSLTGGNKVENFGLCTITMPLPASMEPYNGEISVYTMYGTELEAIDPDISLSGEGTWQFTFSTSHFSEYAVVYTSSSQEDEDTNGETDDSGDTDSTDDTEDTDSVDDTDNTDDVEDTGSTDDEGDTVDSSDDGEDADAEDDSDSGSGSSSRSKSGTSSRSGGSSTSSSSASTGSRNKSTGNYTNPVVTNVVPVGPSSVSRLPYRFGNDNIDPDDDVVENDSGDDGTVKLKKSKFTQVYWWGKDKSTFTWKDIKKADGYELQYSTSKKFDKQATKTITSKKSSAVVNGLTVGKTYYIRVRPYAGQGVLKNQGKWSHKIVVTRKR